MEYKVRIHLDNEIKEVRTSEGTNLLNLLRSSDVQMVTPCGGKGTCGKCVVKLKGNAAELTGQEQKLLGSKAVSEGYRLACCTSISSDIDVYLHSTEAQAKIATAGREREVKLDPAVKKKAIELETPSIDNQLSDIDRVLEKLGSHKPVSSLELLKRLPEVLRSDNYRVTVLTSSENLLDVKPGDTTDRFYGIAVDIGTTTIAAYIYDLNTGKKLEVLSMLNPQKKFGADVISRIEYTINQINGLAEMHEVIASGINEIIEKGTKKLGIKKDDLYEAVFVGNTTMMHFLMGINAANIAAAPFIPATTGPHCVNAAELDLDINPEGLAFVFPMVSGYIGADTVAAVLSSGMYEDDGTALLVDIGTNGEIVLGNSKWLYSCSTAAGPAFEGANIRCGMGGITGAIDSVRFENGKVSCTVIGDAKPAGICGSGLIDAIAGMLEAGIIDETGRLPDADELEGPAALYSDRLQEMDGIKCFILTRSGESAAGHVVITQKDIRELQNAKAAIAAGIYTLSARAGIGLSDINSVYLAGGFGSYISKKGAVAIGLIPAELEGKIESIGNAAGAGAIEGLLSAAMMEKAKEIRKRIEYVELSSSADFVDKYVECMMFPEK